MGIAALILWCLSAFQLLALFADGMKTVPEASRSQGFLFLATVAAAALLSLGWVGSFFIS